MDQPSVPVAKPARVELPTTGVNTQKGVPASTKGNYPQVEGHETGESRNRGDALLALTEVHVAEYLALRSEIEWLIKDGSQYQAYAIALVAAVPALLQFLYQSAPETLLPTLLIVQFPFVLLGFLYYRQLEEIHIVAGYLANSLRPRVREITDDPHAWSWEEYKDAFSLPGVGILCRISSGKIILVLRALLFLLPSVIAVGLAVSLTIFGTPYFPNNWLARVTILLGLAFDFVITVLLILVLVRRGDLSRRLLNLEDSSQAGDVSKKPLRWFAERTRTQIDVLSEAIRRDLRRTSKK